MYNEQLMLNADLKYTVLLGCLILGPIVLILSLTNRWLWISVPRQHDHISLYAWNQYGPQGAFLPENQALVDPDAENSLLFIFFVPEAGLNSFEGEFAWNGDVLNLYESWRDVETGDPVWSFAFDDSCRLFFNDSSRECTPEDRDLLSTAASFDLINVDYSGIPNSPATATVRSAYIDITPLSLMHRQHGAINWLVAGIVMTIVGMFYFYGPRRGWLRWREGLTLPDDSTMWES
jgi:hypothetical protein